VTPRRRAFPTVHPTAVVTGNVRLAESARVGPLAVLCGPLRLGAGSVVDGLAVLEGPAVFGRETRVHPFAALGGPPQDRTYDGEPTRLVAGDGNVFREHVTVHRGTRKGGGVTRLGHRNLLMAGVHVAHDCRLGNEVQLANGVSLAGHVEVGDHAVFGGHAAVAPFVRVGRTAMVAGGAMVDRDVPPFCVVRGDRAWVAALNVVGLHRRGAGPRTVELLRRAFQRLFRAPGPFAAALRDCAPLARREPLVAELLRFLRRSRLGVRRAPGG
jgi:UDP-N-acetylglucosamine acyltransferase